MENEHSLTWYRAKKKTAVYEDVPNETLVARIKDGDNAAVEQLFLQNTGLIYDVAKKYASHADIDDLMQEAYFAMMKAVESFDPCQECKFSTYFSRCMCNAFQRYVYSTQNTKRLPDYMQSWVIKYKKFLAQCLGEGMDPTDAEICAALEITEKQLASLRKAMHESVCMSLSEPVPGTDEITIEDLAADPYDLEEQAVEEIARQQLSDQIWKIVDEMGGNKSKVIVERYHNSKTLEEVGDQLHLSPERIRQIEKKALKILERQKEICDIAREYGYFESSKLYEGSLSSFKVHGNSIVEYLVMKKEERLEWKAEPKQKTVDELFDEIMNLMTE